MPNFNAVFKSEVSRLARKEVRQLTHATRKAATAHRREIAALKRAVGDLTRQVAFLERREKSRLETAPSAEQGEALRFSPKWVQADRKRLGISAADYAKLVGVSTLTIYNWEHGRSKPRAKQLAAWGEVRGLGKREIVKRLELLGA
jgi:DNA-binding transcriptional regulator YiaG